jgi:hypothetical protein
LKDGAGHVLAITCDESAVAWRRRESFSGIPLEVLWFQEMLSRPDILRHCRKSGFSSSSSSKSHQDSLLPAHRRGDSGDRTQSFCFVTEVWTVLYVNSNHWPIQQPLISLFKAGKAQLRSHSQGIQCLQRVVSTIQLVQPFNALP